MNNEKNRQPNYPGRHEQFEKLKKDNVIDGNEISAALAITLGDEMNSLRRTIHVMEQAAPKNTGPNRTPSKKKRRKR